MKKGQKSEKKQNRQSGPTSRNPQVPGSLLHSRLSQTDMIVLGAILLVLICAELVVLCVSSLVRSDKASGQLEKQVVIQTGTQLVLEKIESTYEVTATTPIMPAATLEAIENETVAEDTTEDTTEETIPEETETDAAINQLVEDTLNRMSLSDKVYQLFIVTPEVLVDNAVSTVVPAGEMSQDALQQKPVGGVICFSQDLLDGDQTSAMINGMQTYAKESGAGVGLWIAVDEEGGIVARVADKLGTTSYPSMQYYGNQGNINEVERVGSDIAHDIAGYGFNLGR